LREPLAHATVARSKVKGQRSKVKGQKAKVRSRQPCALGT
jgi:hypothetical protein